MTTLYKITDDELIPIQRKSLAREELLEKWIFENPMIVGLDLLVLGSQIVTDYNGRIDILAIDREGNLNIIELKRDRTPRDIVAQVLDYASWITSLTTKRVHEIAHDKLGKRLELAFQERFDTPLPENLNSSHSIVIVASEFDASSKRIVEYLAEEHGVSINTAFFNVFEENGQELIATDWLMDQQEVVERAENRKKLPWSGYYYVNTGHDIGVRSWEDMREYGFLAAGRGRYYSKRLEQLEEGDKIYAYQKGSGYMGDGRVKSQAVMAKDFVLDDGRKLTEVDLQEPAILENIDDSELADYVVGVEWIKTLPVNEGKTFTGAFANQNIVCKLRDPATLTFLAQNFGS